MKRWNLHRPFKGAKGASGTGEPGPDGRSAYQIAVDNGFIGNEAAWLLSLKGEPGSDGDDGIAATIGVNSTTTGAPGTNASITNVGTSSAASLDFTIPRGNPGSDGAAATISVNSTTTGAPGTNASVTNVGTSNAALLNFVIPRGDQGSQGPPGPSKRIVTATLTTNASGVASLTYSPAFGGVPNVHADITVPANNRQRVRLTSSTAAGCSILVEQQNTALLSLLGIDILTAGVTLVNGSSVRITAIET